MRSEDLLRGMDKIKQACALPEVHDFARISIRKMFIRRKTLC
jgi:hypothetical protein